MSPSSAGIIAAGGGSVLPWDTTIAALAPWAWYQLNNGAITTDSSGNGRTATNSMSGVAAAASLVPQQAGAANKSITKTGGNLVTPSLTAPYSSGGVTVALLIKSDGVGHVGNGVMFRHSTTFTAQRSSNSPNETMWGYTFNGTNFAVEAQSSIDDNAPHLLLFTAMDDVQEAWRDGVLKHTGTISNTTDTVSNLDFGGGSSLHKFNDGLDEFLIWNRVLTSGEIASVFASAGF